MDKPIAYFLYDAQGLSVRFSDRSSGIVASRQWAFQNGTPATSTDEVVDVSFPAGTHTISLTVTNDGGSATFTYPIIVSADSLHLNQSIKQMVECDLPNGLALDSICFNESIRKWMLFLYTPSLMNEGDVFKEDKWPSLTRVLISKLIVYDLVVKAAASSMTSFIAAAQSFNSISNQITSTTAQVADYAWEFPLDFDYPLTIELLEVNGLPYENPIAISNNTGLLSYLNSLNIGVFVIDAGVLKTLGNSNLITTFNISYGVGLGINSSFTQSNVRVVPLSIITASSSGGISSGQKGPLKKIETGPTTAEWYDSSEYWSNVLRSSGGGAGANGLQGSAAQNGIFGLLAINICAYGSKLGYKLPMCKVVKNTHLFINSGYPVAPPPDTIEKSWFDTQW